MKNYLFNTNKPIKSNLRQMVILMIALVMSFQVQAGAITDISDTAVASYSGTVVDGSGAPLIGVNILIKETSLGTITDFDGNFTIDANPGDVLEISYVGFVTQEITLTSEAIVNVVMSSDSETLSEIVIIGYGTQKKSHLTGAVSRVENKKLDQIAVARVDDALIGQVSGVNIQATSAEAGDAPTITIRGFGSIDADSGPAVVVDGIVVDPDFLGNSDMNDIASFEVLKDAASAAIYGSEGSNGVIMITTKEGQAGKTKFSYQSYIGYKSAFESEEYKKSVADWAAFELAESGELSDQTQYAQELVSVTGIDRDWQEVFFDGGTVQSHSFAARGGNESTTFSTSLRYLGDEGVVITDDYKLFSAKLKMDTKISDKVKFGLSATPSYSRRRRLPTSIHNPIRQSPWLPIYHTEETLSFINTDRYPDIGVGDYFREDHLREIDFNGDGSDNRPRTSGDMNPYAQYVEREHLEFKTNVLASTYLSYKIADGLVARTSLGITLEQRKRTRYDGTLHHHTFAARAAYELQNRLRSRIISDNTLAYNRGFGDHDLGLLVGATFQKRKTENSVVSGTGFSNDLLPNLQGATTISEFEEVNAEKNKMGYFARVNYAFANKYLVNASFRRDASSVFGVDSKWGNFPAVSLGWNAHLEDFMSDGILSRLKLRASYGLTGNENFSVGDDIINAYPYLALLNTTNAIVDNSISPGVTALNIANTLLQWEASKEFNPGIDFGILDNKITGSLDYYVRTSDKLLLENPVSYVTGFNAGIVNLGEVENSGFEFELRTRNINKSNFNWTSTIIASTNKNELLNFGDSDGQLLQDDFGRNSEWINSVGNPISSFYGYVVDTELASQYWTSPYIPINGTAEDVIVRDLNGDGIITGEDKTILGDPYPDLIWSFTNEFQFNNFDFSFMLQGSQGAQVKNIGDQYFETHWTGATSDEGLRAVVEEGLVPNTTFLQKKVLTNDVVQSAHYFSLRNVNIGYTLSNSQLSRLGLGGLRIYATGQNLIYKTADDYHGFNPEYVDRNDTPTAYGSQRAGTPMFRTVTIGLNLDF